MGGTLTLYTGLTLTPHPIITVSRVFYDHIYVEDSLKILFGSRRGGEAMMTI